MFAVNNKTLFIYGYNDDFGRIDDVIRHGREAGCDFKCIIDKNPTIDMDYDRMTIEEYMDKYEGKFEDTVIFLNFRDGSKHKGIAQDLFAKGIRNLVFIPSGENTFTKKSRQMRKIYNSFLYGNIDKSLLAPELSELDDVDYIICDYGDYVSFWLDINMLYSVDQDNKKHRISELDYYIELYDYLYNGGKYPQKYMDRSLNGRDEAAFMENRRALFDNHKYMIQYDPYGVEDSPILITWDEKDGNYIMKDGHHRAISLIKSGYKRLPVVCKKDDFNRESW